MTDTPQIDFDTILVHSRKHAQREFEGQMLVITSKDSKLHRFNHVGSFIWGLLENPTPVEVIIKEIGKNYANFNKSTDYDSVAQFLLSLKDKGLIVVDRVPAEPCSKRGKEAAAWSRPQREPGASKARDRL